MRFGLLLLGDPDGPTLSRTLRVPDRVTGHLLGDDSPDPALEPYLSATVPLSGPASSRAAAAIRSGAALFYVHQSPGTSGSSMFGAALAEVGLRTLGVDAAAVPADVEVGALLPAVVREAGLLGPGWCWTTPTGWPGATRWRCGASSRRR